MMIELAFVACIATEPDTCRNKSLLYMDVPVMACLMQGQAQLASWTEQHPGWEIKSWRCQVHDTRTAEI